MFVGIDSLKNRIFIDEAKKGEDYFCPICKEKLVIKKGNTKAHHFAHTSKTNCDNWSSDMSDWHYDWQCKFPVDCREVVVTYDGVSHRADILVKESNTVVEFQHSPMKNEEFIERSNFYTKAGYRLIWLFDIQDHFNKGSIQKQNENPCAEFTNYSFKRMPQTFQIDDLNSQVSRYFQWNDGLDPFTIRDIVEIRAFDKEFSVRRYIKLDESTFVSLVNGDYSYKDLPPKKNSMYAIKRPPAINSPDGEYYTYMQKPHSLIDLINKCRGNIILASNINTNERICVEVWKYKGKQIDQVQAFCVGASPIRVEDEKITISDINVACWFLYDEKY